VGAEKCKTWNYLYEYENYLTSEAISYTLNTEAKFEDTKGIIRSRKAKSDVEYNDQAKKYINTNSDLHNTTKKTKNNSNINLTKNQWRA
jgi:RNase P/RNase MRP subunit p30